MSTTAQKETKVSDLVDRDEFIKAVLQDRLSLIVESIEPLGHRQHQNFVYRVRVSPSVPRSFDPNNNTIQPGTVPLPKFEQLDLVVRIANPATNLPSAVKVENEVVALHLARKAGLPVPDVYLWATDVAPEGWCFLVENFMEGAPLDSIWPNLNREQRISAIRNATCVFTRMRSISIPSSLTPFGGFAFTSDGEPKIASYLLTEKGPFTSASAAYHSLVQSQLALAESNTHIKGWRSNGLKERIDRFITDPSGLNRFLELIEAKPVFTHGDFDLMNILVDPISLQVNAVIDFEFASASHPADEFFMSLAEVQLIYEDEPTASQIALTDGFPPFSQDESDDMAMARAYAETLDTEMCGNVPRPSNISGFKDIARVYWFAQQLCQWWCGMEWWWTRGDGDEAEKLATMAESLENSLKSFGF